MTDIVTLALNPAIDIFSEAESVRTSHKVRTFHVSHDPGGGGINVARVVTELGGDVEVVCLAGGSTGSFLEELLDRERIRRRVIPIDGDTRISFTVHELKTGLEYRFVANGPTIGTGDLDACLDAIRACECRYFIASGSLPPGAPADFYARIGGIVAAKGARFVLDSSGPGLIATLERVPVFLLKPSLSELESLVGHPLNDAAAEAAAIDLVHRGSAEMVALTLGPAGALVATKQGVIRARALRVDARSTVGAGDSFLGALMLAFSRGRPLEDCLTMGIAAGAAAVLHPGTKLCSRADTLRLYEEACLQPVMEPAS